MSAGETKGCVSLKTETMLSRLPHCEYIYSQWGGKDDRVRVSFKETRKEMSGEAKTTMSVRTKPPLLRPSSEFVFANCEEGGGRSPPCAMRDYAGVHQGETTTLLSSKTFKGMSRLLQFSNWVREDACRKRRNTTCTHWQTNAALFSNKNAKEDVCQGETTDGLSIMTKTPLSRLLPRVCSLQIVGRIGRLRRCRRDEKEPVQ